MDNRQRATGTRTCGNCGRPLIGDACPEVAFAHNRILIERDDRMRARIDALETAAKRLLDGNRDSLERNLDHLRDVLDETGRPACSVCGAPATNGIGQADRDNPRVAALEFRCERHRPDRGQT